MSEDTRTSLDGSSVAIVYRAIPQYRVAFYEGLRAELKRRGVRLRVLYGQPTKEEAIKADTVDLPWAEPIHNRELRMLGKTLIWQPVFSATRSDDLVIVEQASKLLVNYPLVLSGVLGRRRVAFWGHGRNFQAHDTSVTAERLKGLMSRHVWWWFAYNAKSVSVVEALGYPSDRITNVQNAIDTAELVATKLAMTAEMVDGVRAQLGIEPGGRVCAFVGGMYPGRRLEFLVSACDRIRELEPAFEMVFVGGGVSAGVVEAACATRPWMHFLGPRFGVEKDRILASCELMLMPGLVGLAALDCFALEVPMVTTLVPDESSPEAEYLVDGSNAVVVAEADSEMAYAQAVVDLLGDPDRAAVLRAGCRESAARYTMAEMVRRFADGVCAALAAGPLRR